MGVPINVFGVFRDVCLHPICRRLPVKISGNKTFLVAIQSRGVDTAFKGGVGKQPTRKIQNKGKK